MTEHKRQQLAQRLRSINFPISGITPVNILYTSQSFANDVRDSVIIWLRREVKAWNSNHTNPQDDDKEKEAPKNAVTTVTYLRAPYTIPPTPYYYVRFVIFPSYIYSFHRVVHTCNSTWYRKSH